MKKPHPLIKISVLLFSIVLLSGFVAYRTGALDRILYGPVTDTIPRGDTSRKTVRVDSFYIDEKEMMTSSKSGYVVYSLEKVGDTLKKPGSDTSKTKPKDTIIPRKMLMSSSKSMVLIAPKTATQDSIPSPAPRPVDTVRPARFYGTKSAPIIRSTDVEKILKEDKKKQKKEKKKNKED